MVSHNVPHVGHKNMSSIPRKLLAQGSMYSWNPVIAIRDHWVKASGYFERRWRDNEWKCSFDTLSKQLDEKFSQHGTQNALGCLRFLGFVDDHGVLAKQDVRQVVNVNTV